MQQMMQTDIGTSVLPLLMGTLNTLIQNTARVFFTDSQYSTIRMAAILYLTTESQYSANLWMQNDLVCKVSKQTLNVNENWEKKRHTEAFYSSILIFLLQL